jgi:hypothetical protein
MAVRRGEKRGFLVYLTFFLCCPCLHKRPANSWLYSLKLPVYWLHTVLFAQAW